MRRRASIILSLVFLIPNLAFAACTSSGGTVVYVNGIFTSLTDAQKDLKKLKEKYQERTKDYTINFTNGYNPTHLGGLGDVIQSVTQAFVKPVSDFDLQTILLQIHPEVKTRKLLLVGHSQGTFYTNEMYDYLLSHGEPKEAVGVYNIATPASYVAGNGKYLTSSNDKLIQLVQGLASNWNAKEPLPANILIPLTPEQEVDPNGGHSLSGVYLAEASDRIISDISVELAGLKATYASETGDCFTTPPLDMAYKSKQALFAITDSAVIGAKVGLSISEKALATVSNAAIALVGGAFNLVASVQESQKSLVNDTQTTLTDEPHTEKNFKVLKSLYGSSLTEEDVQDLLGDTAEQGAAAALAAPPQTAETTPPPVSETPTPTFSIPPAPVFVPDLGGAAPPSEVVSAPLVATVPPVPIILFDASTSPPILTVTECAYSLSKDFCFIPTTSPNISWSAVEGATEYQVLIGGSSIATTTTTSFSPTLTDDATSTIEISAVDASSTVLTSASQSIYVFTRPVVINEIAWSGTNASSNDQWVELYNRTPYELDATRLVLSATEGGAQYIPLQGKINGDNIVQGFPRLYVLQREAGIYKSNGTAPVTAEFEPLSQDGQQLVLSVVTLVGTTTLDTTPSVSSCGGWCAGSVPTTQGYASVRTPTPLSMERINPEGEGVEPSNWASNDGYARNASDRNDQRIVGSPGYKNSSHFPMVGWSCSGDIKIFTPDDSPVTYTPASNTCTGYGGFVDSDSSVFSGAYKGVVGSSTIMTGGAYFPATDKISLSASLNTSELSVGDEFFILYMGVNTNIGHSDLVYVPYVIEYVKTGSWGGGNTDQPPLGYKVISFIYQP